MPLDVIKGKKVACLSGIGNPGALERTLGALGVEVSASFQFPDHHEYSQRDLAEVFSQSQERKADCVVTTEKDGVKLLTFPATLFPIPVYVMRIALKVIKNEQEFLDRLLRIYPL